ncbi:MAG: DUF881 domain-containing protein [Peptococcaceae bacterium]|nr:DUF881 domain-containing protein [Peptococcaceae bacterium]MBO5366461.1 DUF881 domain-containing protein [Peptococcaceae bacterium]
MKKRIHGWQIYLAITFMLLGILISIQIQTQNRLDSDLASQSTSDLTIMIKNQTDRRLLLTEELAEAEYNLELYQEEYIDDSLLLSQINNDISRLELINGTVPAKGSGIQITVSGNLLASDLSVLVNEFWAAGAEAVSINNVRITPYSGFSYIGTSTATYLTCGDEILTEPIILQAVGNSATLERSIVMPGGIADNLEVYQIYLDIQHAEELHLPAIPSQPQLQYGKVPEKTEQQSS